MSLPNAGPISLSQIQTIMGGTSPVSLSEYYTNANPAYTSGISGIPALGNAISVSMFLGKTNNTGFSPTTISGLGLWLDAADYSTFTLSGNNVTQWNDKSGNSRNFANPTTTSQPVYESNTFNGKPCISTIINKFLYRSASTMGTLASGSTFSIFVVGETDFTYAWSIFFTNWFDLGGSSPVARFHCSFRDNVTNKLTLYANGALQSSTGSTATNTRYVACFVYAGNGATCTSSLNGAASTFTGTVNLPNSSTFGTSIFSVGDGRNLNYTCKRIAEVIMYDRALTTTERQSVETYLMNKYGIT